MYRISEIETAILGLVCEGPHYGYELEKVIEERQMRNWTQIGFSSIYYVLNRLEKYGYIRSKFKQIPGKPARKIYSVTSTGKTVMVEMIKDYISTSKKISNPFDLGMANLDLLNPKEVLSSLEEYLISLDERLNQIEDRFKIIKQMEVPINIIALFSRPITIIKSEKEWVNQFIKDYKNEILKESKRGS